MYACPVSSISGRTTGLRAILDPSPTTSTWYLVVTADENSRVVPLPDGAEVVFGRSSDCAVIVEDSAMSRRHAMVRRQREAIFVEDLGSRNGTTLERLADHQPRLVTAGDVIAIGPVVVIVCTSATARGRQLATVDEMSERLEVEVERALRYRRPLGLAMLRFEGGGDAVMEHVVELLGQLRRIDLVAEYSPDEIALILPETALAGTEQVAQRAAGAIGRYGVAAIPEDGASAGELVDVARSRLRDARVRGPSGRAQSIQHLQVGTARLVIVDPVMKQLFKLVDKIAATPISVLIAGETGIGKEVVAEALHERGPRASGPFVRLNCARAARDAARERAVRPRDAARSPARRARKLGAVRGGRRRHAVPRRDRRAAARACRPSCCACSRAQISASAARTEIDVDVAPDRRDEPRPRGRGQRAAGSARTCTIGISAFVDPVPPLRERRDRDRAARAHFAHELAPRSASRRPASRRDALGALSATTGPATCASCAT